ncbi:hypothetical protein EC913_104239 [Pseudomonas sp. LP_4_YM]|nr:hypothetical protein D0O09_01925 [Pseudomonas putida]TCT98768.1 hypothetical protein EC913_104239 [Pseudomonas sp. LP_4_YM]
MISHQSHRWRDRSERAIEMSRFQDIKHLIIKLSVPHQGKGLLGGNLQRCQVALLPLKATDNPVRNAIRRDLNVYLNLR